MQIDPNSQAPLSATPLSDTVNAPPATPSIGGRRSKNERKAPERPRADERPEIVDADSLEPLVADGSESAVLDSTDLEPVIRRLRSGAYNTREMADAIARRLLASGDI